MKTVIWLTLTLFIENGYAFGLEQLDQKKYLFTGEIIQEDVNSFINLPDQADIYIDSQGGDGVAAFEIAKIIHKKNVTLIVFGSCSSACNYLFLASAKKIVLPYTFIGMHGLGWNAGAEVLLNRCKNKKSADCNFFRKKKEAIAERITFFSKLGISNNFFTYFQRKFSPNGKYVHFNKCNYKIENEKSYTKKYRSTISNGCYLTWGTGKPGNDMELFIPNSEFMKKHGVQGIQYFWYPNNEKSKEYIKKITKTSEIAFAK